jgi:hypothetical protein
LREVQTIIESTIPSFATSSETTNAGMNDAVGQAKTVYEPILSSLSAWVDAFGVGADTIGRKAAVWEPLLEKIKLCTEIVDKNRGGNYFFKGTSARFV